jgi:hypothetical protein
MYELSCIECKQVFDNEKLVNSKRAVRSHYNQVHGSRVEKECIVCGDSFKVPPSLDEAYVTCSDECRVQNLSELQKGENNINWSEHVEVECVICGKKEYLTPAHAERYRTCGSDRCNSEYRSKRFSGEGNVNYKDGNTLKHQKNYGPYWDKKREKAIKRDNEECQKCGISREGHEKKYDQDLVVDHIKPFRLFDDYKEANKLSNLKTYCCVCHIVEEHQKELNEQELG